MTFGKVLRQLRKEFGLTQKSLSQHLGIAESTIGMYEREQREPDFETLEAIADYFNVDMDYLTGRSSIRKSGNFHVLPNLGYATSSYLVNCLMSDPPSPDVVAPILSHYSKSIAQLSPSGKGVRIPVLGDVAAGIPIDAIENIVDYEEIDAAMAATGEFFGLRIKGSSMEPRIREGDVVIVRKQEDADTGDTAVVLVNGDSATVKRIKKEPSGISLIPNNPAYDTKFYSADAINSLPVRIIGKVVELRGKF